MNQSNYLLTNGKLTKFDVQKTPEFKERNNIDWVIYGTDKDWYNRQPDYYVHLYNSSPKNNAIINRKCSYIYGQGLYCDGFGLDLQAKLKVNAFIASLEENKVFERTVKDLIIQGGFANEMIYNKGLDKVTPHHIDFSNIRVSKPEYDEQGRKKDPVYYYTCDWSKGRRAEQNEDFTIFYPFKADEKPDKNKRYLFYYKDYRPNLGVYPLPEYLACVPYISADYEISNFTYNNVKNGFSSGYLVNFYNGDPSEGQKRMVTEALSQSHNGSDNAGKNIVSFNEDKESGVEITPISPNGQDERYINLNNSIRDEIYTGHGVDPVIVGLKGDNGFNNNADEKRTAIEEWQNDYVDSRQRIFESYFTNILNYNGISGNIEVIKKKKGTVAPSENEIREILTIEERRERIGYSAQKPQPKATYVKQSKEEDFESYTDYPKGATSNAKRALEWADNNGWGSCGTDVGKRRANQLANREPISLETIKRAFSFLSRHEQNKDVPYSEGCGGLMYDAWGGDAMKRYAKAKIKKVEDEKLVQQFTNCGTPDGDLVFLDSREEPIFSTEDAFAKEKEYIDRFATKTEINVLKMIISGLKATEIKKTLNLNDEQYNLVIKNLTEDGFLSEEGLATEKGEKEAKENEIFVVYKYVKRSDVDGPAIKDTTRPFCRELVLQSRFKSWTLEDIKKMNNGMGLDVFTSRGGWRTIEGTDRHVPFCRHIWQQRLVTRR